jgi:hypothetical protein
MPLPQDDLNSEHFLKKRKITRMEPKNTVKEGLITTIGYLQFIKS